MQGRALMRGRVSHLYLHVPFCRSICPYCDYAVTDRTEDLQRWLDALGRELEIREGRGVEIAELETILVGGGTPSLLGGDAMSGLRSMLGEERLAGLLEWTVEANPEDVSGRLLDGWLGAGVTRINLGIQSLAPAALEFLGRRHRAEEATEVMGRTARSGLPTWGVDLLYGLPPHLDADPLESVEDVIAAGAPHISLYELVAEPSTPLFRNVEDGSVTLADEDARADQYLALVAHLEAAGYRAYEMTAFARPGHESSHALAVLSGRAWLGLGPGAHTRLGGDRSRNLRDWSGYLDSVIRGELPVAQSESEDGDGVVLEAFWFQLRRADGLDVEGLSPAQRRLHSEWVERGLAREDSRRLRLTPEGWLRLDELAIELARAEATSDAPLPGL